MGLAVAKDIRTLYFLCDILAGCRFWKPLEVVQNILHIGHIINDFMPTVLPQLKSKNQQNKDMIDFVCVSGGFTQSIHLFCRPVKKKQLLLLTLFCSWTPSSAADDTDYLSTPYIGILFVFILQCPPPMLKASQHL